MERVIQWLDELEDLIFAIALKAERIRTALTFLVFVVTGAALQVFCIMIALRDPPIALAVASLLSVSVLFDAAVGHSPKAWVN